MKMKEIEELFKWIYDLEDQPTRHRINQLYQQFMFERDYKLSKG